MKKYKLVYLCMEINEKTEHKADITIGKTNKKPTFDVVVYESGIIESNTQKPLARVEDITIPNINECRKKLLKYKEW